jgi:16S rRNA (cytosine1402-N4)-methyltransferase
VIDQPPDAPPAHTRRRRYQGTHPRAFHDKYKELQPDRYPGEQQKTLDSGRTPAGTHVPIMVDEVLECLRPAPGDTAVDCTLGAGGHARAILGRILPGGRLIGLDVDPLELPRTEAALRAEGFGPEVFVARHATFAGIAKVLASEGVAAADIVLADFGVSSMQFDNPDRGFSYKGVGPLDMRMNPQRGEPASRLIARLDEAALAYLLIDHADEPHAALIAGLLKAQPLETTHAADRHLRAGIAAALPRLDKTEVKMSIRRTFQALRIAVNDEFGAIDALLRSLPGCLAPGGRAAVLTFHSGEDRRVKKAFQAGLRAGLYAAVADAVIRSGKDETFRNRRASSAKLRWAVRAAAL